MDALDEIFVGCLSIGAFRVVEVCSSFHEERMCLREDGGERGGGGRRYGVGNCGERGFVCAHYFEDVSVVVYYALCESVKVRADVVGVLEEFRGVSVWAMIYDEAVEGSGAVVV